MTIVCQQTILMKYHTLLFLKLGKMLQNLSSAAGVIGALRVKVHCISNFIFLTLIRKTRNNTYYCFEGNSYYCPDPATSFPLPLRYLLYQPD